MVGDQVHYMSYGTPGGEYTPACRAATVTEVVELSVQDRGQAEIEQWDPAARCDVGLCVMNPTGLFFNRGVTWDPNHGGGTWHWPEPRED